MQLFRPEALQGQDRLHGQVILVPPVSWQLLGGFLLAAIAIAAIFLATSQYTKITTVSGRLTGDKGIVRAMPPRAGIIHSVLVQEGQHVAAGAPLARISILTSDGEASLEARRYAAIARREEILKDRSPELTRIAQARLTALQAQIDGDRAEALSIRAQMSEQLELVRSAREDLDRARAVASRGFLSARDILSREEQFAVRKQALSRLDQELTARSARIAAAEAELLRARSELQLQLADVAAARAELAGVSAADENASAIVVTASQAGAVTGITVHAGDRVTTDTPIMSIVPDGTRLQAQIEVPPAAAGFLEAGQTIRLAVEAFPYQTYGTIDARVDSVSMATVPIAGTNDGRASEAFLIRATLRRDGLAAYGRVQPLRPGMTVTARIATRSRNLAEWLFDPLFAVARR